MAHKNKLSLIAQVNERIKSFDKRGQSKHKAKDEHGHVDDIYSNSTFDKYLHVCCAFVKWCIEHYKCKTLDDCRQYVDEWISKMIKQNYKRLPSICALRPKPPVPSNRFGKRWGAKTAGASPRPTDIIRVLIYFIRFFQPQSDHQVRGGVNRRQKRVCGE